MYGFIVHTVKLVVGLRVNAIFTDFAQTDILASICQSRSFMEVMTCFAALKQTNIGVCGIGIVQKL